MHPVDSNDLSFKIAGMMAFKQAFQQADPLLLEPVNALTIHCPDELTGAVMGEVQSRRGFVEGMETEGHFQKILAKVPVSELGDFSSSLRSLTQGRSRFQMAFDCYQPVSPEQQKKLTEEYSKIAMEAAV
jgi:elongation factor G